YGASDDLIEIDGDLNEEFSYGDRPGPGDVLAFSDGTLLGIEYTSHGIWRISPLKQGACELSVIQAVGADDDRYSDRAILKGDIKWVVHGINYVLKRGADK